MRSFHDDSLSRRVMDREILSYTQIPILETFVKYAPEQCFNPCSAALVPSFISVSQVFPVKFFSNLHLH